MLEKTKLVEGIEVNYKTAGEGKPLLVLHGWGSSSDSWVEVQNMLAEKGYQVIVPDLAGFGKTSAPSTIWGVEEYVEFVSKLAVTLGIKKFVLMGHSFGGQIALQFVAGYPEKVEKLVLMAAAAIRHEPGLKAKALALVARFTPQQLKKVLSFVWRRSDYGKAQGIMKDIMKKVITQDLTTQLPRVTAPTLIIWGDKDTVTPIEDAFLMKKHIKNSYLDIFPGVGHRLRAEVPEKLTETIATFLRK